MIFFHVSVMPVTLDNSKSYKFKPRVPLSRMYDEDNKTPRICVSTSLEGCMDAMPYSLGHLGPELPNTLGSALYLFIVFKIDTIKLNIDPGSIINPEVIYNTYNVTDALDNDEYWITSDFTVPKEDIKIMQLSSYEDLVEDYDIIEEHLGIEYIKTFENKQKEELLIHYNLNESQFCMVNFANIRPDDLKDIENGVDSDIIISKELIIIKSKTPDETLVTLLKILEK